MNKVSIHVCSLAKLRDDSTDASMGRLNRQGFLNNDLDRSTHQYKLYTSIIGIFSNKIFTLQN